MVVSEDSPGRRLSLKRFRGSKPFRTGKEGSISAPEEQEREKRYGIRLSALTPDVFMDVLKIYDAVAGLKISRESEYRTFPDRVKKDLEEISRVARGDVFHRMFGSQLSPGSKLSMRSGGEVNGEKIVRIYFEVQENGEGTNEGEKMERRFRERIESYLLGKNLAVEIKYPR